MSFKAHFRRFLEADPDRLHFAAHSHHLWPDVSHEAQMRCWDEAARLADRKWERIFGTLYAQAQQGVAGVLSLARPEGIAFGPNTHGFVMRLLSCLPPDQPIRVLTTDGEFHSFARQIERLEEDGLARAARMPVEPFATFPDRFAAAAARGMYDLIYFSQVFYESGYAVPDLAMLVNAVAEPDTLVVIDGYHGFMALPSDLSPVQDRAFYLAGGYKYAMAGEGVAFLHCPPEIAPRPRDTGWYAAFGALKSGKGKGEGIAYGTDGTRFLGATFDPAGLYRLCAVFEWLDGIGIGAAEIHAHAHALQERFVEGLAKLKLEALHPGQLVVPLSEPSRGNFLAFRTKEAEAIQRALVARNVITDHRGDRLRIGFGLYHDDDDVERLCAALARALG